MADAQKSDQQHSSDKQHTADSAGNTASVSSPTDYVHLSVHGSVGHIVLDRPKALNSLNTDMCAAIERALTAWSTDSAIDVVVITSSTPIAYCAGGDVRRVRELQLEGTEEGRAAADGFFTNEYRMNALLSEFPKPVVAVMNGIVMGGGLGISLHCSHRVITERTWASMPEMAIGFSTDVGISYAMQRLRQPYGDSDGTTSNGLALFMGLTGYRFTQADMLWSGIATHIISSHEVESFVAAIDYHGLDSALDTYARPATEAGSSYVARHIEEINDIFNEGDWFDIEAKLDKGSYDKELIAVIDNLLSSANPSSLVATTLLFRANEKVEDLRQGLRNEFEVGKVLRYQENFAEGVRAVLVDKDMRASFDPHVTGEINPEPFKQALATAQSE
ncbi:3-hydroxyisobutyryl-CoA hydrolase [Corynebacterium kroppenstedtii]|jgi:enoyl-coA hydratase|uniref:3-hydroxyisobutyryl-CoA hydrolase n=1 Tax=Corynebacterium kroppenstedtii TaxID=161879 RepID=A0A2W5UJJ1_9CORY|nr:3-hydroxyisobutyryl-CoA hydrolase [Corynebacterium kroppenstedtii]MDU7287079.1 3-hydroxyisobutyryl-CoA hydrolase [Corynebacterium kroppenstedtii]PZR03454.1 MAG: 3-hydroxyisobutyryl-CoA hydrolase [Corynebacterium kroppenstedtii]